MSEQLQSFIVNFNIRLILTLCVLAFCLALGVCVGSAFAGRVSVQTILAISTALDFSKFHAASLL